MSELTVQTLREIAPEGLAGLLPAAVQIDGRAGVILRQLGDHRVELYHAAQIVQVAVAALDFEPITDPAAQAAALAEAVEALTICRRVAFEAHAEQRQAHTEQLAAIRQYAIAAREQGVIDQQGLDAFLEEFGFEPYGCRTKVTYTISGSYEVNSSPLAAIREAEAHLGPDLMGVLDVADQEVDFVLNVATEEL
ncbi:hypothetical protein AB0K51_27085 [Kitasatospora sp. NPDC049285]|uniref:hypothetical protein n=1 Tax=Kitasatospora sp. NPDC049285 TaxID=3157096 RepID=UPI0034328567